jgi:hypothetical protein
MHFPSSYSKYTIEWYCDAYTFLLELLGLNETKDNWTISVIFTTKDDERAEEYEVEPDVVGMTGSDQNEKEIEVFIFVDYFKSDASRMETLCHEMVHVRQAIQGRSPNEHEAYALEAPLYAAVVTHIDNRSQTCH